MKKIILFFVLLKIAEVSLLLSRFVFLRQEIKKMSKSLEWNDPFVTNSGNVIRSPQNEVSANLVWQFEGWDKVSDEALETFEANC